MRAVSFSTSQGASTVHEDDVGIVLGIPSGDIDVSSTSVSEEQIDLLRASIGLVGSDPRSIK